MSAALERQDWAAIAASADPASCVITVDDRHFQVHQNQVEGIPRLASGQSQIHGVTPIAYPDDFEAEQVELPGENRLEIGVILGH